MKPTKKENETLKFKIENSQRAKCGCLIFNSLVVRQCAEAQTRLIVLQKLEKRGVNYKNSMQYPKYIKHLNTAINEFKN